MRVYQFMPANYALEDLRQRRLKVSLLEDLNDPFELLGARLERADHRQQLRGWRKYMSDISRLLCFSKKYSNPVLWSHYADKHRGICLSFEVPNILLLDIRYDADRFVVDFQQEAAKAGGVSRELSDRLLTTKYADWDYESEVRMFVRPEEVIHENGLQFFPFGDELALRAVYAGPRCENTRSEIAAALQTEDRGIEIHATRLAFKSFHVIRTPWKVAHSTLQKRRGG